MVELEPKDLPEEYLEMFEDTWPKALDRLKELAEG